MVLHRLSPSLSSSFSSSVISLLPHLSGMLYGLIGVEQGLWDSLQNIQMEGKEGGG
jgi:hypothetical protein